MELQNQFEEIRILISEAKGRVFQSVNKELINLYWNVGKYVSERIKSSEWGKSVVENLFEYLRKTDSTAKGFFFSEYMENEAIL